MIDRVKESSSRAEGLPASPNHSTISSVQHRLNSVPDIQKEGKKRREKKKKKEGKKNQSFSMKISF